MKLAPTPDEPGYHGRIQMGGEVYRFDGRLIKSALKVGDSLSVPTLFGRVLAEVTDITDDRATAMSGDMICWLTFAGDDRRCWTCGATGDSKALAKIAIL